MRTTINFRPAGIQDAAQISRLISSSSRLHRHLDWRPPVEWLGSQPFWVAEANQRIQAALAIPPDPPTIAWVRLFVCTSAVNPAEIFDQLLVRCLEDPALGPGSIIPALALSDWFSLILKHAGFEHSQNIVSLERETLLKLSGELTNPNLYIRTMEPDDLGQVTKIDNAAFEPIWQNSPVQIQESYTQSEIATVAEFDDEIVGYQFSTINMFAAHLARLAVNPAFQNRQIGSNLLIDLFKRCKAERLWKISVNTQDNNHASLALYQKHGFRLTGEQFPVYLYQPTA